VIRLLESGAVEELSLDHDLGDDERGTAATDRPFAEGNGKLSRACSEYDCQIPVGALKASIGKTVCMLTNVARAIWPTFCVFGQIFTECAQARTTEPMLSHPRWQMT
jgi:hypothetical protein